jgi:peptidoglycan/xylan/chitin deacetylase (PgdA/CDA1 family)
MRFLAHPYVPHVGTFFLGVLIGVSAVAFLPLSATGATGLLAAPLSAPIEDEVLIESFSTAARSPEIADLSLGLRPYMASSAPSRIRIPVIVYHSVRPHYDGESREQDQYDVTPELLEEELRYLVEGDYHTITFRDVDAAIDRGVPLPDRPVILSFDDGWKNQYIYAFPLLQKYQLRGTFFIYTNPIDHENAKWMSWDDVRALDRAGMEIGGHSRTHPILTRLRGRDALDGEIGESKRTIEGELGHSITSFAYPFGLYDAATVAAVMRAGYTTARTVHPGVWNDISDRFELHGTLSSDHLSDFESTVAGE